MALAIPILMPDDDIRPLIGQQIGSGVSRTVHTHRDRTDVVIKAHRRLPCRANLTEWLLYNQIRRVPALTGLFARVLSLSDSGRFLIMERLTPLDDQPLPAFPAFLTDRKRENFGLSPSGVKCLDYGDVNLTDVLALSPLTRLEFNKKAL